MLMYLQPWHVACGVRFVYCLGHAQVLSCLRRFCPCHQMKDNWLGFRCIYVCLRVLLLYQRAALVQGPVAVSTSHSGTAELLSTAIRARVQPESTSVYARTHDTLAVPVGASRAAGCSCYQRQQLRKLVGRVVSNRTRSAQT
jgi:hypothetical protein